MVPLDARRRHHALRRPAASTASGSGRGRGRGRGRPPDAAIASAVALGAVVLELLVARGAEAREAAHRRCPAGAGYHQQSIAHRGAARRTRIPAPTSRVGGAGEGGEAARIGERGGGERRGIGEVEETCGRRRRLLWAAAAAAYSRAGRCSGSRSGPGVGRTETGKRGTETGG